MSEGTALLQYRYRVQVIVGGVYVYANTTKLRDLGEIYQEALEAAVAWLEAGETMVEILVHTQDMVFRLRS